MNRLHRRTTTLFLAAAALLTGACGDADPGVVTATPAPVPGTLEARLATDAPDIGAVVFRVHPGDPAVAMEAPTAARSDLQVFTAPADHGWTVAVLGQGLQGALVRWDVPDVGAAADYTIELVEAADEANAIRDNLTRTGMEVAVR